MNIGIFDTEHFETTYTLIRLMQVPGNNLFVFTDTHCKQRMMESLNENGTQVHWIVQQEGESHRKFIGRMNTLLSDHNIELLFYNTISNNHLLHAILLRNHRSTRTILTVHDINELTGNTFWPSPRELYRNIGRRQLINRVHEFNVISETMIPYLREKIGTQVIIHNIPGAIFEQKPPALEISDTINLVIPGSIDNKRRDYLQALELIIEADAAHLKVNLTFLGSPYGSYGNDIVKAARKLKLKRAKIVVHENEVPQPEFENVLKQSHFVFIPSVRFSNSPSRNVEVYGETKISGGLYDAVRQAKPLIIPSFLKVPAAIEKRCKRYEHVGDIIPFLKELLSHRKEYEQWQLNALESSQHYTVDKVRSANASLFA